MKNINHLIARLTAVALIATGGSASAAGSLSSVDSFRVGSTGVLCTAQSRSTDSRFANMFDRGYDVVCRDAATPVGKVYALKMNKRSGADRFEAGREKGIKCEAPVSADFANSAGVRKSACTVESTGLNYTVYSAQRGGVFYAAEGLSAYESALKLGLMSVMADKSVPGEITVASTNAGDPAAFAKVQAASLDPTQALSAGYERNNEGSYAESAEFFEALSSRSRSGDPSADRPAEYLANLAIQQSNLGNRAEADRLFAEAAKVADGSDPLFARLFQNLKIMHRLNARDADGAAVTLNQDIAIVSDKTADVENLRKGFIDRKMASRLAAEDGALSKLGGGTELLTTTERASLLDAQRLYLQAVVQRLKKNYTASSDSLNKSISTYSAIRGGSVVSMAWLQATANVELSAIAEAKGNYQQAKSYLQQSVATYQNKYPGSATLLGAKARVAGLQARNNEREQAIATFRELVKQAPTTPGGSEALRTLIRPYFNALVEQKGPQSADDFFAASQAMVRPGVAQTQAVLARELSGGSSEASSLFRQSVTLTRELVSTDVEISRLAELESPTAADVTALAAAREKRVQVGAAQTAILAKLAAFPKFRVMSNSVLKLSDLQATLRDSEGYYKLLLVGESAYGVFVTPKSADVFRIPATKTRLEKMVNTLRDSIVVEEANQLTTKAFDVVSSRDMYLKLFGPVQAQMGAIKHLIFEPDGPLLKLPANVLITEQAGVDAYLAAQKGSNPDEFDFTGIRWLGRDRMVSTAVSAQSFVDVRNITPSKATRRYLGVGQNTPTAKLAYAPQTEEGRDPCDWGLSLWNKPISAAELRLASSVLGGDNNLLITEDGYSDTTLRERTDLNDFRIIQFATHGLVTASHPGCPARPALVTSFGERNSDGLLSFKEIFDLKLDADTIILSACDTAGAATAAATREAGISTGGNFALDGLVRAFVGAGARTVVASHWPVPDDYDATKKLMTGFYEGSTTIAKGEAMRLSAIKLMDDPLTSHPYYWAAFAIVGDASKPLTTANSPVQASAPDAQTKS